MAELDDEKAKSLMPFGTEQSVESNALLYLKHSGWTSPSEMFSSVEVEITNANAVQYTGIEIELGNLFVAVECMSLW